MSGDTEVVNVPFWSTPRTIVVQQFSAADPTKPACRARDEGSAVWYPPGAGCLEPDFNYLSRVDAGPDGLVAIHSSAEGRSAISVARYSVSAGQSRPILTLVLEGAGAIDVGFAPDGSRVDFVTPCPLSAQGETLCVDPEAASRWKLYSMPTTGGPLTLRRDDLPPGTAFDSSSERFAWARGAEVCVGDPRLPHPRCSELEVSRPLGPR